MSRLWLIASHEYRHHVLKRSFLLTLLAVPIVAAVVVGVTFFARTFRSDTTLAVGYVDHAGLLAHPIPAETGLAEEVQMTAYATEEAARAALGWEEIQAYYVVAADYLETARVELVYADELSGDVIGPFSDFLRVNLLADQPPDVVNRAIAGSDLIVRSPDGTSEFSGAVALGQFLPALAGFGLVVLIFISSGYLMQAVVEEKANRTIEILTTSVSPNHLMIGKVLGIIGVTITELVAWLALTYPIIMIGRHGLGLDWLQSLEVDPSAILITLALAIPSYVLVAGLITAFGATLVDVQAGQQVTAMVMTLYLTPVWFIVPLLRNLNGPLAVGMSLFPLTGPVVLPLRTAFTQVPAVQVGASVAVHVLCAAGAMWLAGRALRAGMLRYGRRVRLRELFGAEPEQPVRETRQAANREGALGAGQRAERTSDRSTRSKTLLVLRHELTTLVTRPLFLGVCVGVPLLVIVQLTAMNAASDGDLIGGEPVPVGTAASAPGSPEVEAVGYVDQSGWIQTVPDSVPTAALAQYPDEASARQALTEGEITAFYVVPADYASRGQLVSVRPHYSPLSREGTADEMERLLLVNLLQGDIALAERVQDPMELEVTPWTPSPEAASAEGPSVTPEQESAARLLTLLITLLLYGVIVMASSLLLNSISGEKKSRVMEILMGSVSPQQLLRGKIVAMGLAGLLQAAIWIGVGTLFLALTGRTLSLPPGIDLSPSTLAWTAVFFLLGYAVYASLMAGAGALLPDIERSRTVSLVLIVPALIGFEISIWTAESPHGTLSTASSLFPLTAPFTMVTRLVTGGVPLWQLLLSAALMLGTAYLVIRAVAAMFHAQNLLSGQRFTFKRYLRALVGRA